MTVHSKSIKTSNQAQALLHRGFTVQPLSSQYITPSSVDIPYRNPPRLHHGLRLYSSTDTKPSQPEKVLDGFILLESTGMGFPEDARTANMSGGGYHAVVVEDMHFFTGLVYLDVCDNHFNLQHFEMLPRLHELRIACNGIRDIEYNEGFSHLQYLDMSYNKLSQRSIDALSNLPLLRELDLSGNNLRRLPSIDSSTSKWPALEVLLLENNKFTDSSVFCVLANMPQLRCVNLARNMLSTVPQTCCATTCFRLLECLDVAYNYFASEDEFIPLVQLPRLLAILLYGNPILGPTGEDPLGIYIEGLIAVAAEARDEHNEPLELITEAPRAREFLKGQDPGRQAVYRHFPIVQVDDERDSVAKTAKQYREEGNRTLFGSAVAVAKKQNVDMKTATNIASNTFLTTGHMSEIADSVMEKVANTMKLGEQKDISKLEQTLNRNFSDSSDVLPNDLFSRSMDQSLPSYPLPMNSAIKSLRFALKHPLSDHNEVPSSGLFPTKHYVKPTALTDVRQKPRIKYTEKKQKPPTSTTTAATTTSTEIGSSKRRQPSEQSAVTFKQIEDVLDGLNINSSALQSKHSTTDVRSVVRPSTAIKGLIDMVNTVMDDIES